VCAEADFTAVITVADFRMMIFGLCDPGDGIYKGEGLLIVLATELVLNLFAVVNYVPVLKF